MHSSASSFRRGWPPPRAGTSNAFPWGRGSLGLLHQAIYDSSHFYGQGVMYPIVIQGLRWRPNTGVGLAATTFTNPCSIRCSTSPVDWSATTTTFSNQRGVDETLCFQGTVSYPAQPAAIGPTPFGINVPLTTPFTYNPDTGDLNVECDLPIQPSGLGSPQLDVHGTVGEANAARVYWSTGYAGYPGGVATGRDLNHAVVVQIDYAPAPGLGAGFISNVTSGPTPLTVNFTSTSVTTAPGGILSYAWDFDGDSVIDSTAQNPTFTYTTCGQYNVTLTVTDGVNPPDSATSNGHIKTDLIVANFDVQAIGPLLMQFTDTSNMPATSWAWDLDGDSVIDSNLQNPVFLYPSAAHTNVTLTVTRLCAPPSTVTKNIYPTQNLSTNLVANNGGASLWTVYYNITVLNPLGVSIDSLDVITTTLSTPFTIDCFLKLGTHVGSEYQPAPWTKVGTASGTSNPVSNGPSHAAFPQPLYIPAGTYGMALRYVGIIPRYTTQAAVTTVSNADLSLQLGSAAATTVAPFQGTSTTVNTPRAWSGTLHYSTTNITGVAGHGWFGPGCAGTMGVSHQAYVTRPVTGGTLSVNIDGLPFGVAVMVIGATRFPAPVDLGIIGAPGCPLYISLDATETVIGAPPSATWNFAIPNAPVLAGSLLYNQAAVFDPAANAFGFVMGDAAGWVVGTL
ncbi:MAG TPA: PKD domain-containing protein [Planctomycetota bacterium]